VDIASAAIPSVRKGEITMVVVGARVFSGKVNPGGSIFSEVRPVAGIDENVGSVLIESQFEVVT